MSFMWHHVFNLYFNCNKLFEFTSFLCWISIFFLMNDHVLIFYHYAHEGLSEPLIFFLQIFPYLYLKVTLHHPLYYAHYHSPTKKLNTRLCDVTTSCAETIRGLFGKLITFFFLPYKLVNVVTKLIHSCVIELKCLAAQS